MRRSLPVLAGLGAALAFLPRAWAHAWGALILVFAVLAAPAFVDAAPHGGLAWVRAIWSVVAVIAGLIGQGALYRLGVTRSTADARKLGLGIGGLQFGLPELRLLGAGVFVGAFVTLVCAAFVLVLVFILTAESASLPAPEALVTAARNGEGWALWLVAFGALFLGALIQLVVRLSLFRAATVARRSLVSIDAMSLVQGAFWPLFLGLLVVAAPLILIAGWEHGLVAQGFVMPISSKAYIFARAAFLVLVELPFSVGFLSYAYNRLEYRPRG